MVSFNCSTCQDVVKKPKVISHAASCGSQTFSCVDCMKVFDLNSVKNHTACMQEHTKVQRNWKGPVKKEKLDTSDEEEEEEKRRQEAASGKKLPVRRARLNFDSSSSDDDDAKQRQQQQAKKNTNKKSADSSSAAAADVVAPEAPKAPQQQQKREKVTAMGGHNTPVTITFQVAASSTEFKQMVQQELGQRWDSGETVSAKAAAKVMAESIAQSKGFKAGVQAAITGQFRGDVKVE